MIKEINGGVTAPKGFAAVGIAAGIKKGKKDMAAERKLRSGSIK